MESDTANSRLFLKTQARKRYMARLDGIDEKEAQMSESRMSDEKFHKYFLTFVGISYIVAGVPHFTSPDFYLPMMPPYLPFHLELVYLSGVVEILCGILLLIPKTRIWGAWLSILTFLAVFPANIYMAQNPELFPKIPETMLYIRLPFQILFIYWAYLFTKQERA